MNYKWINPLFITDKDLPLVVLVDDRRSFIGWGIKHKSGNYCHIMEMHKPGFVASQNFNGFREIPIKKYMKPQMFLKFWKVEMTEEQRKDWISRINVDLTRKWFQKRYDFLGILGQALNIRWIQSPWAKYCSEQVGSRLRSVFNIPIKDLNLRRTPSEIDFFMKSYEKVKFTPYGYWWQG